MAKKINPEVVENAKAAGYEPVESVVLHSAGVLLTTQKNGVQLPWKEDVNFTKSLCLEMSSVQQIADCFGLHLNKDGESLPPIFHEQLDIDRTNMILARIEHGTLFLIVGYQDGDDIELLRTAHGGPFDVYWPDPKKSESPAESPRE